MDLQASREYPTITDYVDVPLQPTAARTVLVAGSRTIFDVGRVCAELAVHLNEAHCCFKVISGGAGGVDTIAKQYAQLNRLPFQEYPAAWHEHGLKAGPLRNARMVAECDLAVIFWDGASRGTKDTLDNLRLARKPYCLYHWPEYSSAGPKLVRNLNSRSSSHPRSPGVPN